MKELTRTKVDRFEIQNSVTLKQLEENKILNKDLVEIEKENYIYTVEDIFWENPKIILNERKKELFLNGVMLTFELEENIYRIYSGKNEEFLGLGVVKNSLLKRDVIL